MALNDFILLHSQNECVNGIGKVVDYVQLYSDKVMISNWARNVNSTNYYSTLQKKERKKKLKWIPFSLRFYRRPLFPYKRIQMRRLYFIRLFNFHSTEMWNANAVVMLWFVLYITWNCVGCHCCLHTYFVDSAVFVFNYSIRSNKQYFRLTLLAKVL